MYDSNIQSDLPTRHPEIIMKFKTFRWSMRTKLTRNNAREDDITAMIDSVCDGCAAVLLNCMLLQILEVKRAKVSIWNLILSFVLH